MAHLDPRRLATTDIEFEGTGDEARQWLDQAYGASLGLAGRMGAVRHRRLESEGVAVDHLTIDAPITFDAEPLPGIVVVDVVRGQIEYTRSGTTDSGVDGDSLLATGWGVPFSGRGNGYEVRNTRISPEVLSGAIRDLHPDRSTDDLVFDSFVPRSPAAGARWRVTLDEFTRSYPAHDGSVARGSATRLLALTMLHTFPNNVVAAGSLADVGRDRRDASQSAVRRAQAVIEARADEDLSIGDIAQACAVTPRALQYAFRQHLGCTPLTYLRRVRLDLVRLSLRDGSAASVSDAAVRLGFLNPGRFATEYRQAYGENPRDTLRRGRS